MAHKLRSIQTQVVVALLVISTLLLILWLIFSSIVEPFPVTPSPARQAAIGAIINDRVSTAPSPRHEQAWADVLAVIAEAERLRADEDVDPPDDDPLAVFDVQLTPLLALEYIGNPAELGDPDQVLQAATEGTAMLKSIGYFDTWSRWAETPWIGWDSPIGGFEEVMAPMLEVVRPVRQAARYLSSSATLDARAGRHADAINKLETVSMLGTTTAALPPLIAKLVGVAVSTLASNVLVELALDQALDDASLKRAAGILRDADTPGTPDSIRAMIEFERLHSALIDRRLDPSDMEDGFWKAILDAAVDDCAEAAARPHPSFRYDLSASLDLSPTDQLPNQFIRQTWRVWEQIRRSARNEHVAALTAIAIERYRLKQNDIPDSLDALVPDYLEELQADALYGSPLRYRVLPQPDAQGRRRYIIYSIGYDKKDNDGATPAPPASRSRGGYSSENPGTDVVLIESNP